MAECPVCGSVFEPDTGPQLFLAGTPEPVCERCAKIHSPQMFALWQHAQKQHEQLEKFTGGDFAQCPKCKGIFEPAGLAIALHGEPLCDACARKADPLLAALLRDYCRKSKILEMISMALARPS